MKQELKCVARFKQIPFGTCFSNLCVAQRDTLYLESSKISPAVIHLEGFSEHYFVHRCVFIKCREILNWTALVGNSEHTVGAFGETKAAAKME